MNAVDHRAGLPGLAFLAQAVECRSAPAAFERRLGFRLTKAEAGYVNLCAEPDRDCSNPMQGLHGGFIAAMLDTAMSTAVDSLLMPGQSFTTVDLKISYLRAVRAPFGSVHASGTVRKAGRRIVFAEGKVYLEDGELLAIGAATCLVTGG